MGNYIITKINQSAFPPVPGAVNHLLYSYLPPLDGNGDEIVILHSYGNMETCKDRGLQLRVNIIMKRMKNVSFVLYDYPTRGEGTNETAVNEMIVRVYESFHIKYKDKKKIYLFGRSIGCVPTCHLVDYLIQRNRIHEIQGVILQSPMCSAFSMFFPFCHDYLCFTPLPCLDQLNNLKIIQQNQTKWPRTMIISGALDVLVSPAHCRHLFKFMPKHSVYLMLTTRDHNNIDYNENAEDSPLRELTLFIEYK